MRARRTFLVAVVAVTVVAAVLVGVALWTPPGAVLAARIGRRYLADSYGLELTVESTTGRLARGVTYGGVSLRDPAGARLFEADSVTATVVTSGLLRKHVHLEGVRVEGASFVFEAAEGGGTVGWSQFARGNSTEGNSEGQWEVTFDLTLSGVAVSVLNARSGLDLTITGLEGTATGRPTDLATALAGSVSYSAPVFDRPVAGRFETDLRLAGLELSVDGLDLVSNGGDASAAGSMSFGEPPSLDLSIDSRHRLEQLAALLGAGPTGGAPTGGLAAATSVSGPFDSVSYSSELSGEGVGYAEETLRSLSASLTGDAGGLTVTDLRAAGLGGELAARAELSFPEPGADAGTPSVDAQASFNGLSLARLAAVARADAPDIAGDISGELTVAMPSSRMDELSASFGLDVPDLSIDGSHLGAFVLSGSADEGTARAEGSCCGTNIAATAVLDAAGVTEAKLDLEARNLSALSTAFGVEDLAGWGVAAVTLSDAGGEPAVFAEAVFPDLSYRGVQAAPARLEGRGDDGAYVFDFRVFDTTLTGTATVDTSGRYSASVSADRFDLAAVVPDSIREPMSLAGVVSGEAAVEGTASGAYAVTGTVNALELAARRQKMSLTAPFRFAATPDSVGISEAALAGTFGDLRVAGGYTTSNVIDVRASFRDVDLPGLHQFLPREVEAPPEGRVDGNLRLAGLRRAPEFVADLSLSDFSTAGLALSTATFEASGDSADVMFDLVAKSAVAGSIAMGGSVPVRPDSLSILTLDPGRELGVSVLASGFVVDAGAAVLPGLRGQKRLTLDGSTLLTGTPDSLSSIYGSGLFTMLSASLDLVELALSDTVYFEIDGGSVAFEELAVDLTRKRVLGEPAGGSFVAGGVVDPKGNLDLTVRTRGLDVGHLARALGPGTGAEFKGLLDAQADVRGPAASPDASVTWSIDSPRLLDFGFDSLEGEGTLADGVFTIDRTTLAADESFVEVAGTVSTGGAAGPGDVAAGARESTPGVTFDLRVRSDDFRLDRLTALPPDIDELSGLLSVDLAVTGTSDAISTDGDLRVRRGRVEGFGLVDPIKDISLDLAAAGSAAVLSGASAGVGSGTVEASGFVDFSEGMSSPTFYLSGQLNSPEFEVEDLLYGTVDGSIDWGGTPARSRLRGRVTVEELTVTRSFGLADVVARGPAVIVVGRLEDPRENVELELDIDIEESIEVDSNLAKLSLAGGATVGGTLKNPRVSGSVRSDGGTFSYLSNDFEVDRLVVSFIDPSRRDPYLDLLGIAEVESREEETYQVTARFDGYLNEAVPVLTSTPSLSEPDIVSLLTFGTTFGALVSGDSGSGSAGDTFTGLAGRAFLSSAFGLAESTLERFLRLDRVAFEEEALTNGNVADADVTVGKDFGGRLRVNYTTAVGRFSTQRVEVSYELLKRLWLETRTDPEGNHAVGLKLQIPFR